MHALRVDCVSSLLSLERLKDNNIMMPVMNRNDCSEVIPTSALVLCLALEFVCMYQTECFRNWSGLHCFLKICTRQKKPACVFFLSLSWCCSTFGLFCFSLCVSCRWPLLSFSISFGEVWWKLFLFCRMWAQGLRFRYMYLGVYCKSRNICVQNFLMLSSYHHLYAQYFYTNVTLTCHIKAQWLILQLPYAF